MPLFEQPTTAYAVTLAGITIGYIELLRPGLILPGVTGAVLAMLGIASLLPHCTGFRASLLLAAAVALFVTDLFLDWHGIAALAAAILFSFAIHQLTVGKIGLVFAFLFTLPFLTCTWWLAGIAIRARALKTAI